MDRPFEARIFIGNHLYQSPAIKNPSQGNAQCAEKEKAAGAAPLRCKRAL